MISITIFLRRKGCWTLVALSPTILRDEHKKDVLLFENNYELLCGRKLAVKMIVMEMKKNNRHAIVIMLITPS